MICKDTIAELVQRTIQNNGYSMKVFDDGSFKKNIVSFLDCFNENDEILDEASQIFVSIGHGNDQDVIDLFI